MPRLRPYQILHLLDEAEKSNAEMKAKKEWNRVFNESQDLEKYFNDILRSYGIKDNYYVTSEIINAGEGALYMEKHLVDIYVDQLKEYVKLGGDPSFIPSYEEIGNHLHKLMIKKNNQY